MIYWNKALWVAILERAIKTMATALGVSLAFDTVGVTALPWSTALGLAASAGVGSVILSIASLPLGEHKGSPSVVSEILLVEGPLAEEPETSVVGVSEVSLAEPVPSPIGFVAS